jgi:hypothetical protein
MESASLDAALHLESSMIHIDRRNLHIHPKVPVYGSNWMHLAHRWACYARWLVGHTSWEISEMKAKVGVRF